MHPCAHLHTCRANATHACPSHTVKFREQSLQPIAGQHTLTALCLCGLSAKSHTRHADAPDSPCATYATERFTVWKRHADCIMSTYALSECWVRCPKSGTDARHKPPAWLLADAPGMQRPASAQVCSDMSRPHPRARSRMLSELLGASAPRLGARMQDAAAHRTRECCRMQQNARQAGARCSPRPLPTGALLQWAALSASLHAGVRPAWRARHEGPAQVLTPARPARAGSRALGRGLQVQQPLADVLLQRLRLHQRLARPCAARARSSRRCAPGAPASGRARALRDVLWAGASLPNGRVARAFRWPRAHPARLHAWQSRRRPHAGGSRLPARPVLAQDIPSACESTALCKKNRAQRKMQHSQHTLFPC